MKYASIAIVVCLLTGCNPVYKQEHEAFSKMIDAKVAAKKITYEEGEYEKQKNKREIYERETNPSNPINVNVRQQ